MEKKYQKLYIWSFIIISGIILLMLYTPLGGDLHNSTYGNYDNYSSPGVNFNGRINNAPKSGRANSTQTYNNNIPTNSGSGYSALSSPIVAGNGSSGSHSGTQNGHYSARNLNSSNNRPTGTGSGIGGTGMIALGGNRGGGSGSSTGGGSFGGGGMFSSATPSSMTEGVMQKNDGFEESPIADPGGGDPVGDPIPVGEGIYILLMLGIIYTYYIFRKTNKESTN
ncbi:MAG: hypothetical protein JXR27_07285 [Paludibacteraceae bacterium]|nr:hypothetical protein [Paludibacteraceae bacterium]